MSAETADNAGTPQLRQFHMVNIKTKFPRGIKSDQVISKRTCDGESERAPGPGLKLPGPRPISNANKGLIHRRQASSNKLTKSQASSGKHQAPSTKAQA